MLKDLYILKKDLSSQGIFFCFSGPISQSLVSEVGAILEQKMTLEKASKSAVLRVFSMVVEKAQNIIHYSAERFAEKDQDSDEDIRFGIIAVGHENGRYFVLCGNMIHNNETERLNEKLSKVRNMSKDELKQYYREQRKKGPEQGSKGAGLGFIDIAKKANEPIDFHFRKIDDNYTFFSIKTVI